MSSVSPIAVLALALAGCEAAESRGMSGALFEPVPIATPVVTPAPAAAAGPDPRFPHQPPFAMTSEELHTKGTGAPPSGLDVATVPAAPATTGEVSPAPTTAAGGGWPVRLVSTVPQAMPPRAILGFPDGSETVVTPGTMIPEHQLVVVSIGPSSVQLAQVTPAGDHAQVSPITLDSQY